MNWSDLINCVKLIPVLVFAYIAVCLTAAAFSTGNNRKLASRLLQQRKKHAAHRRLTPPSLTGSKAIYAELARQYIERDGLDVEIQ